MFYLMVQIVLIVVILIKVSYCMCCSLCCAKIIKRDNLLDNVVKMGVILQELLMMKIDPLDIVANIRGRGLFWGIEFCKKINFTTI